MAVRLAAILAFLFYFNAVPVKFAFMLRLSSGAGFGAGVSAFEGRFAVRRARQRALGEKKRLPWKRAERDVDRAAILPAVLAAGRYLLRHLHLDALRASGRVSTPDAAKTALLCGCASALEAALAPCAQSSLVRLRLEPDFSGAGSDVTLCGMVSLRLGHIMLAALIGARHFLIRRIQHGKASH